MLGVCFLKAAVRAEMGSVIFVSIGTRRFQCTDSADRNVSIWVLLPRSVRSWCLKCWTRLSRENWV